MTSSDKCEHCGNKYEGVYASHWNDCIEARRVSNCFTPVNMFENRQDYAKQNVNKEFADFSRKCPDCSNTYNYTLIDHQERCPILQMNRQKNKTPKIPLFQETRIKTEAEQIAELRQEVANLKRKLNV
jgi:hypothetical protein